MDPVNYRQLPALAAANNYADVLKAYARSGSAIQDKAYVTFQSIVNVAYLNAERAGHQKCVKRLMKLGVTGSLTFTCHYPCLLNLIICHKFVV